MVYHSFSDVAKAVAIQVTENMKNSQSEKLR